MLININEIKINEGRRAASPEAIDAMIASVKEVGMMNPITVTADHTLVAGLHRLEAAKRLGWTEIECSIIKADTLHAELAEIDENYVRANLTALESSRLMLRRKEIYEALHPETKAGIAQAAAMNRGADVADKLSATSAPKSFAEDTADKLGVDARTIRRQVQIAKDLTPEAQQIIEDSGEKVTQQNLLKLSKLDPEQQTEAAGQLVAGEIRSVDAFGKGETTTTEIGSKPDSAGNALVNAFTKAVHTLHSVPENFKGHCEDYRKLLAAEQLQEMIETAKEGCMVLSEFIALLNQELASMDNAGEVSE